MKNEGWWNWIQRGLAAKGMNTSHLSEQIGIQRTSIYGWRDKSNPTAENVRAVAEALGKTPVEAFIALGWLNEHEVGAVTLQADASELTKEQLLTELAIRIPGPEVIVTAESTPALKRAPAKTRQARTSAAKPSRAIGKKKP